MSQYVLDVLIWILGTRGHIPHNGDFRPVPGPSPFGANAGTMMRTLAVFVVVAALLSLVLWLAVWLAIL